MNSHISWSIIKHFSCRNTFGFRLEDVERVFPGRSGIHLARILADMVEKGMLYKIDRNLFHIIPIQADPESYIPDGCQLAKYFTLNMKYYIGYHTALKIHGLSSQPEGRVYVVTGKQMKPAIRSIGGIAFQFVSHGSTRFFGYESMWINRFEKAMISDLEKTIVDIATKPQLCGGILEVGHALFQAKDRTDQARLFFYLARNMNMSARRRILFLSDILGLEQTKEHDKMRKYLGSGITTLDPSKANQGRTLKKYRLRINVEPDQIRKRVLPYNNGIPGSYHQESEMIEWRLAQSTSTFEFPSSIRP